MTTQEINKIHSQKLAIVGKKYQDDFGNVYIGTETKRLRLVDNADVVNFKTTSEISQTNVQDAIEAIGRNLVSRIKQTEIDFGFELYKSQKSFTIVDLDVTSTSKIFAQIAYIKPTNKDLDELDMDEITLKCGSNDGYITIMATSTTGSVYGSFPINYQISY